jgi:hypothetical protein
MSGGQDHERPATACPLCGQPLYGWIVLPPASGGASVGLPLSADPAAERVIDRCEECGVALEHGVEVDLIAEWEAVCRAADEGGRAILVPNRASLQAAIGVEGWAAIDLSAGRLLLTRPSLELLAERNGHRIESVGTPPSWRAQRWMWQTLLNGFTFHPNFAREVRAGRLRPGTGRGRLAFAADALVTTLGALLVAIVSLPLELGAATFKRGGELSAHAVATPGGASSNGGRAGA